MWTTSRSGPGILHASLYIFVFERQIERSPICWFYSKFLHQPGLGQDKAKRLKFNPSLPCGCWGPKDVCHCLLLCSVGISKKQELEVGLRLELQCGMQGFLLAFNLPCQMSPLSSVYWLKTRGPVENSRPWLITVWTQTLVLDDCSKHPPHPTS